MHACLLGEQFLLGLMNRLSETFSCHADEMLSASELF